MTGGAVAGSTVGAWRRAAAVRISTDGPADASPALEADLLLMHALGIERTVLFAHPERALSAESRAALDALVVRRLDGEPIAYLTGRREFLDREFAVRPGVLVPRPETELLVELAVEAVRALPPRDDPVVVLELGTGSGIVASSIAARLADVGPAPFVVATDVDPVALDVARENAHAPGVPALARGSWLDAIGDGCVDVLVSNPPYVASGDPHLAALAHEPLHALASGPDGLDAIREIVAEAPRVLRPGGVVLLEHGHDQGAAVRGLVGDAGLLDARTERDLAGRDRVSLAWAPRSGARRCLDPDPAASCPARRS